MNQRDVRTGQPDVRLKSCLAPCVTSPFTIKLSFRYAKTYKTKTLCSSAVLFLAAYSRLVPVYSACTELKALLNIASVKSVSVAVEIQSC